jgi:hypothetical protein
MFNQSEAQQTSGEITCSTKKYATSFNEHLTLRYSDPKLLRIPQIYLIWMMSLCYSLSALEIALEDTAHPSKKRISDFGLLVQKMKKRRFFGDSCFEEGR